eukprot:scaffold35639_cov129-Isochrysis_galbana.AAC.2
MPVRETLRGLGEDEAAKGGKPVRGVMFRHRPARCVQGPIHPLHLPPSLRERGSFQMRNCE